MFPNIVVDPERRGKVMLDRLFCIGCVLVCTTGPALMAFGTTLLSVTDNRAANIELYNSAVGLWAADGGGLQRFGLAAFTVSAAPSSATYNASFAGVNTLEPFSEAIESGLDFEGASTGRLRTVDEGITAHFPYHFRSTGQLLGMAAWHADDSAVPEYTFTVAAEYRTPQARRSTLSIRAPIFQNEQRTMTKEACLFRRGRWLGGSSYEGGCLLVNRLQAVCIRTKLNVDFTWMLDTVGPDGGVDSGCWWRDGAMQTALYTPLVKADTPISLGGVVFMVRSTDDPNVAAERMTDGTMYFGKNYADQRVIGVMFWILGVVACLPCCIVVCLLQRTLSTKRRQRVLGGQLEEVDGDSRSAQIGGGSSSGGKGGGTSRLGEMKVGGGSVVKRGSDSGYEMPIARGGAGEDAPSPSPSRGSQSGSDAGCAKPLPAKVSFTYQL